MLEAKRRIHILYIFKESCFEPRKQGTKKSGWEQKREGSKKTTLGLDTAASAQSYTYQVLTINTHYIIKHTQLICMLYL